jgi:hypothetical protein
LIGGSKLNEKLNELKLCYKSLFGDEIATQSYIEVLAHEGEVVLSANKEGLVYIIKELIILCENGETGRHYHLDEAGMANKCEKPLVIQLIDTP